MYIAQMWNYIDLIAPLGVVIIQIIQFLEINDYQINEDFNRSILSISTLFMWIKLLYVMRIFKNTGYLIRMLIEVVSDMGIFLLLLLITILAFGDSFLRLSNGNSEDSQFIEHFFYAGLYVYRMILGDWDTDTFGEISLPLVWILFVMCTIFEMIVMLNLLIAIISDTYAHVAENSEQAGFQEMAKLIEENEFLVPYHIKKQQAKKMQYLLLIDPVENIEKKDDSVVILKVESVLKQIENNKKDLDTSIKQMNNKIDNIVTQIVKIQQDHQKALTNEIQQLKAEIQLNKEKEVVQPVQAPAIDAQEPPK
ncbi:wd-40 repeat protein [Stylonychia lemnae]|uniref:Wd-40 repeat protein n=1 Tax=Stylonychia lemnae TaxID=5949 RepID=A0A078B6F8_STYLE|nr:wd-40 repeat protein [Stylonychia lemnae]|eukprot:CDW88872.1 wd-40 repeat protein [Stylonychia lemnae]